MIRQVIGPNVVGRIKLIARDGFLFFYRTIRLAAITQIKIHYF